MNNTKNERINFAATNSIKDVLKALNATLVGLDSTGVTASRNEYGTNKVTKEKKKYLKD